MPTRPLTKSEQSWWGLTPAMKRELLKYREEQVRRWVATNDHSTPALVSRGLLAMEIFGGVPLVVLTAAGRVVISLLLELEAANV